MSNAYKKILRLHDSKISLITTCCLFLGWDCPYHWNPLSGSYSGMKCVDGLCSVSLERLLCKSSKGETLHLQWSLQLVKIQNDTQPPVKLFRFLIPSLSGIFHICFRWLWEKLSEFQLLKKAYKTLCSSFSVKVNISVLKNYRNGSLAIITPLYLLPGL